MLLLMLSIMVAFISAFSNYNLSAKSQLQVQSERSQEKIVISQIDTDPTQGDKITFIHINNIGTIEVRIRALYGETNGIMSFLDDPSLYSSTYIPEGGSKAINVAPLDLYLSDTKLIAATERGTLSLAINELELKFDEPLDYDPSQYSIGPLMLNFTTLNYTKTNSAGVIQTPWPGWPLTSETKYCGWTIAITNLDTQNRSITLNQFTGFTVSVVGGPQTATWYLEPDKSNPLTLTQEIPHNESRTILYLYDQAKNDKKNTVQEVPSPDTYNIFLTFFGTYEDGSPFSQTVPFEAIRIVKK